MCFITTHDGKLCFRTFYFYFVVYSSLSICNIRIPIWLISFLVLLYPSLLCIHQFRARFVFLLFYFIEDSFNRNIDTLRFYCLSQRYFPSTALSLLSLYFSFLLAYVFCLYASCVCVLLKDAWWNIPLLLLFECNIIFFLNYNYIEWHKEIWE